MLLLSVTFGTLCSSELATVILNLVSLGAVPMVISVTYSHICSIWNVVELFAALFSVLS